VNADTNIDVCFQCGYGYWEEDGQCVSDESGSGPGNETETNETETGPDTEAPRFTWCPPEDQNNYERFENCSLC